jgi:starch synthase (maltosyl-transferring)
MNPTRKNVPRLPPELARRVWVRNLQPSVDDGEFPIKRTAGEKVRVTAEIFADGHDRLAAVLRWRPASEEHWREVPMRAGANDVWSAEFTIASARRHLYTVLAWIDRFATWSDGLRKKHQAGQNVESELLEGAELVRRAAERATEPDRRRLLEDVQALQSDSPQAPRVARALEAGLRSRMDRHPDRFRPTEYDRVLEVDVARERARFGAWYEMFPRSAGDDPSRSATFREAETRLPEIARMGFDVLYLPPIHPIGRTHRKGPNNTLNAGPEDPGSPWAIGGEAGGHTAVHSELGSPEDFEHFVRAASEHGLEVALDLAFQCSPDHPWVTEHPAWFRHRPDGTVKYAENPPKKYQDIYPLDFDTEDWESLWYELKGVVVFWIERGVRIFRVDNPHTKPFRFWGWLISQIKSDYPDTIFLSEAFTRPQVMYALAKVGFDQSYTYFTWRNTKLELTEYMTELTRTEVQEFFRPNLFTNTPDILPEYLQYGGRAAFQVRLVLAATLGASYGVYSGFESCEARAVPGTEEYQDSEKFQIRSWEVDRPGNIREFIARINRIRRDNEALASNDRLEFHPVDNDRLIFYSKATEDLSNIILVVANLDPHHPHDGWVEVPLEELGIAPGEPYQVHDLVGEGRYLWHGMRNYVRLDPSTCPAQIFRVRRKVRTERDFDYYL